MDRKEYIEIEEYVCQCLKYANSSEGQNKIQEALKKVAQKQDAIEKQMSVSSILWREAFTI